jgi:molybdopterin-guanine dinucleotide biosynthesis protein A
MNVLGVVMAGGRNTRFGDLKAFAEVGGQRIVDRVISALRAVTDDVVMIANDFAAYETVLLEKRRDILVDVGALAGIHSALLWAQERGSNGIIAVACDMPFPSVSLLRNIAGESESHDVVIPESDGRRGVEPLFAYYSVDCVAAIDAAVQRADRRMIAFHDDVDVLRIPIDQVRRHGDPEVMFMNVNTREDLELAVRIASEHA